MSVASNFVETVTNYLGELNSSFKDNKVKKRNGQVVSFDLMKIYNAIDKCFGKVDCPHTVANVTYGVSHALFHFDNYTPNYVFTIEEVQDAVETELMRSHPKIAKKYIIYREQRAKAREDKKAFDVDSIIGGYIGRGDWRVKENASIGYSVGGLILHNSATMSAWYWLQKIYTKEIRDAHLHGDFHIHDLGYLASYCQGLSLRKIIMEGVPGLNGNLASAPARHFLTALQHILNVMGIFQNENSGAIAFSSIDTWLAPFVRYDNLSYNQVKQGMQSLIFGLNTPSRWGCQPIFSNFTFDTKPPKDLKESPAIIGGKWWKKPQEDMVSVGGAYVPDCLIEANSECYDSGKFFTYSDFQREMDMINKAFIEIMIDGDRYGRTFSYPIPTYNITEDFDWESESSKLLFKLTGKYGTPYFQNFLNSDLDPSDVRSMCCRLQLSLSELRKRGGGLFGSVEFTGSCGVVTINLPKIGYKAYQELKQDGVSITDVAYESKVTEAFIKHLRKVMDLARDSLELKKKTIKQFSEYGMYPYTMDHIRHWNNHFLTIGILGMEEALENMFGSVNSESLTSATGRRVALKLMNYVRETIIGYQEETGNLYNFEAVPCESTSYRLAKISKQIYPDIITAGTAEAPYFTNSTQLKVGFTDDMFEAADAQECYQVLYTGGTVFHAHLGERVEDPVTVGKLVKKLASNYRIPYFTISPTFSVCSDCGYLAGEHPTCPKCGKEATVYARIVGYYRAVKNWNIGKAQEFKERKTFKVVAP